VVSGDPITASAGGRLTPAQIAERKAAAGFDRPLLSQYWDYLTGLFRGDFGTTLTDRRPISDLIVVNGAATLELAVWALLVAMIVGIPLGLFAATHRDRVPDVVLRLLAVLFYAAPVFFVGMLLKLLFSVKLGWLPASGRFSASTEIALAACGRRPTCDRRRHPLRQQHLHRRRSQTRGAAGAGPRTADRPACSCAWSG
jgi:ABC-type dipeptide/oligopeptide/nickel transport systems, permease components